MGGSRSSVRDTDRHQQAEDRFLHETAAKIDALVHAGAITSLVLAAPPKAMGVLRTKMSPATKEMILTETAKDLVKLPTAELQQHLAAMGQLR